MAGDRKVAQVVEKYELFYSTDSPFSNFHPCRFVLPHPADAKSMIAYNCGEQRIMHMKALMSGDNETATDILQAKSPTVQKALGRKVKGFKDSVWASARKGVAKEMLRAKFLQNPHLLNKLLQVTGAFAEASLKDRIWGIGLSADDPRARHRATWRGANLLGECLTELRDALVAEGWRAQASGIPSRASRGGAAGGARRQTVPLPAAGTAPPGIRIVPPGKPREPVPRTKPGQPVPAARGGLRPAVRGGLRPAVRAAGPAHEPAPAPPAATPRRSEPPVAMGEGPIAEHV
jgi:ribA/ribD-fused uncharacterized protein